MAGFVAGFLFLELLPSLLLVPGLILLLGRGRRRPGRVAGR